MTKFSIAPSIEKGVDPQNKLAEIHLKEIDRLLFDGFLICIFNIELYVYYLLQILRHS